MATERGKEIATRYAQSERGRLSKKLANKKYHASPKGRYMHDLYRSSPEEVVKGHARWKVNNALRDGRIFKSPCKHCGAIKTEAHHESYEESKWLEVIWLCRKCHKKIHA